MKQIKRTLRLGRPPEERLQQLLYEVGSLQENLRTVHHSINNDITSIIALAELSQQYPSLGKKLSQLCMERLSQVTTTITNFSERFNGTLDLQ